MFLINILLALAWMALTGSFGYADLLFGFALGYVVLWPARGLLGGTRYFTAAPRAIGFVLYLLWEIIVANWKMTRLVLFSRRTDLRPGIVAVPLDLQRDAEITLLANMITLTPGTLSLDVSTDRKVLFVHSVHVDDADAFRRSIKDGFERAVRRLFE